MTFSNSISVAEHVVMMILALVRNYIPSHGWVVEKGWNIADCVQRSYDLEGMAVGTVGAGPPRDDPAHLGIIPVGAGAGAHSHSAGNATRGSEEAAKF